MVTVILYLPDGAVRISRASPGTRLSELLPPTELDLPCGGAGRCGKCCILAQGALSLPDTAELSLLGSSFSEGYRLACRTRLLGDAAITLQNHGNTQPVIQECGAMPPFPLDPLFTRYGASVDIGTTTLAARLYDSCGNLLSHSSAPNPQRAWGGDVITRIEKSLSGGQAPLAACARDAVNRLLRTMAEQAGIPSESIETVVLTGNTTMLYLLTAKNVACLSRAPFVADELFGRDALPGELLLPSVPHARLVFPRCMSAFVGADITTAVLASGICEGSGNTLLADIGTNGELALWDGKLLRCCSTAAGPVFEGAEISQGMQGRPGAIDHVVRKQDFLACHVIGDGSPLGICGSGVIDAVAALCDLEIIDESGYMEQDPCPLTPEVALTAKDIRMVQLAKSAICAGIRTLLDVSGLRCGDLDRLAVAGGFGSYLNLHSAARIGLFPAELESRAVVLGNAALAGASMILLNRDLLARSVVLADQSETVDLTTSRVFTEHYIDCMEF